MIEEIATVKRKAKIPANFSFWSQSMQIVWLEQHGYPEIATELKEPKS